MLSLKPTISMKPRFILSTLAIFIFITCSQKFCLAQDESPKWQLRFQIAPGISYHNLLNKDGSTETEAIIGVWNDIDHPAFMWGSDFYVARKLGRFQIITGLGFSQVGFRQNIDSLNFGIYPPPPDPYPTALKSSAHYQGVALPVLFHYETRTNKWSWFIEAGGGLNWFFNVRNKSTVNYSDGSEDKVVSNDYEGYELKHPYPFARIATGINYHLSNTWAIQVSPTASYFFMASNKDRDPEDLAIAPHFYLIGVNTGACFSF